MLLFNSDMRNTQKSIVLIWKYQNTSLLTFDTCFPNDDGFILIPGPWYQWRKYQLVVIW